MAFAVPAGSRRPGRALWGGNPVGAGGPVAAVDPVLAVDPAVLAGLGLAAGLARLRRALAAPAGVVFRAVPTEDPAAIGLDAAPAGIAGSVPAPSPREPSGRPEGDAAESMRLVEAAQRGDPEAFGRLYDRYVDLVYRYIYYRVGGRALAEDLTSETFLRALRRIGSFTWQGRDFGAWLITIARNLVADHFKSGRYRLEVTTADLVGDGADRPQQGPEDQVLDAITNAQLLAAVKKLNAEQQECICLRFLQGLSVAETALAMGKNEGAIKALQYRAVRTLGRLLPVEAIA